MESEEPRTTGSSPDPDGIFRLMPMPGIVSRLGSTLSDTAHELSAGPASYLRHALLPDISPDWFPIRLATLIGASFSHPIETLRGATAPDPLDLKRRRRFIPILTASAGVHGVLIIYLIYLAFFSPFAHVRMVNKAYRQFDPNTVLAKLYYPPQILRSAPTGPAMTLEEIRERAEKNKQEMLRRREKAEKEKKEKEEAERKAAAEAAKIAAENKPATPTKFGEINEAPIKDTVKKLYELYQAGGLDLEKEFSVMAGFKVEPDGSLSNIRIIKKSPNKLVDAKALEILWNIGESHALGPVSDLSSATISLDLTENTARLRITAFAPTAEIAKAKADLLNVLFWALRMKEAKGSDVGQLLALVKVRSDGKRVDTDLNVPRAKAAEMMRARFDHPGTPPQ